MCKLKRCISLLSLDGGASLTRATTSQMSQKMTTMATLQDLSPLFQTTTERPEPISVKVEGNLPSWLKGTLIRNGPGRFECGDKSFNHWFDGQGLLHRFNISDGQVTYSNKFVRSQCYADSLKHEKVYHVAFGTCIPPDPCQNILGRFFSRFAAPALPFDNTNVNVFRMKGKMYATSETDSLFEIEPETLNTLQSVDLRKDFPGDVTISAATAHPHQDLDGSLYNVSVTYGPKPSYNVLHIPPALKQLQEKPLQGAEVLCSLPPLSGPAYFHSFGVTERFVIVTEIPLLLNVFKALSYKMCDSSYLEWLYWQPKQCVRFHVVDKKDRKRVGVFTADPFFVFHHVNAFEKDGKIFLDACCYNDSSIVHQLYLHNLRDPVTSIKTGKNKFEVPEVRRYELPLEDLGNRDQEKALRKGKGGLDYTMLYSGLDLPRINYAEHNGKPYRFVYGAGSEKDVIFNKLIKLNVQTREFVTWEESGAFPSEPVFVKNPDGDKEDDGVILTCVINITHQSTSLLILDAKDLKERGRAEVAGITPPSLHGLFE